MKAPRHFGAPLTALLLISSGCAPIDRASECGELADAAAPLARLGTIPPEVTRLEEARKRVAGAHSKLEKLSFDDRRTEGSRRVLARQAAQLADELGAAARSVERPSGAPYRAARARALAAAKELEQTLRTARSECR